MKNVILKRGDDSVAVQVRRRAKTATFTFYKDYDFLMDKTFEDLTPANVEYDRLIADGYEVAF